VLITKHVVCRGKQIPVSDLSPTSGYKVEVQCPACHAIREVHYRSVASAGHYYCRACSIKKKLRKDLPVGYKNNRLTVIAPAEKSGHSLCQCDCGNKKVISNHQIVNGYTKSCGCLLKEHLSAIRNSSPVGENHWNWQGGIAPERTAIMSTANYKQWRTAVFERDNYTCQKCKQVGYILNAHHIEPFHANKQNRLEVSNGITFCNSCHNEYHKIYGRKAGRKELASYMQA
jgi:hypothetical protein